MARFQQIPPGVWNPNFRELDPAAKVVYLYLLTCRHRNTEGLFELPQPYIATDVGLSPDVVAESLDRLQKADLVEYDADAEVVLLVEAMKHQPPKGKPQIDGALKKVGEVPPTRLVDRFLDLAAAYAPDLADRLKGVPIPSDRGPDTVPAGSWGVRDRDRDRDRQLGVEIESGTPSQDDRCHHGFTPASWCGRCEKEGADHSDALFEDDSVDDSVEQSPFWDQSPRSGATSAGEFQSHIGAES